MHITLADGTTKKLIPPRGDAQNDNGIMVVDKDCGLTVIVHKYIYHPTKGWKMKRLVLTKRIEPQFKIGRPLEVAVEIAIK